MDSIEDRLCAAGKHDEFLKMAAKLEKRKINSHAMYDWLTSNGASDEEADEMCNLLLEG